MTSYPVTLVLRRTMSRGKFGELICESPSGEKDLDIHYLHNIFPSLFGGVDEKTREFEITFNVKEVKHK